MEDMILTNVRLSPAEHRAAKRAALDLGIPLAELLRRGLRLVLAEHGAGVLGLQEERAMYQATEPPRADRLRILAETAGALCRYREWPQELSELRADAWRDVWPEPPRPGKSGGMA